MAVTKIWDVKNRLDKTLDYVVNPDKTEYKVKGEDSEDVLNKVISYTADGEKTQMQKYVTAINCNTTYAREQFENVKRHFSKNDGVLAYHGYQSFAEYDNVSADIAHEIGVRFAEELWGERFQIIVSTHLNTDCLHNHFILNSVSFVDGKKYHDCRASYRKMREVSDKLCREYGLTVIENPKQGNEPVYMAQAGKAGMPTRYSMARAAVDEAIGSSRNIIELEMNLKRMGYKVQFSNNRKYWTITPKGWERPIRLYRLGEEYTNDRIIERLSENSGMIKFEIFQRKAKGKRQYILITRKDRISRIGGIKGLYLRYCYMLGYLPKYTQNPKRVHYILKDELIKCEQYTKQIRLMGKYKIESESDLKQFIKVKTEEKNSIIDQRSELQKQARRKLPENEVNVIKENISELSRRLKSIKDEIKLAQAIEVKTSDIQTRMEAIEKEKEVKIR